MPEFNEVISVLKKNRGPKDLMRLIKENISKRIKPYNKYILPGNKPDFLIIGAQKAGTTSLHYYLNQHPRLVGSRPKELRYFHKWIYHGLDINWYERNFNHIWPSDKLFFESTPDYLSCAEAAKSIAEFYPDVKLIVVLRDPVARAYSGWNMYNDFFQKKQNKINKYIAPGRESHVYKLYFENRSIFPSFKEAIDLEIAYKKKNRLVNSLILGKGLYLEQLTPFFNVFDKKQLLILGFRDLINDTEEVLQRIYDFLDVSEYPFRKMNIEPRHVRKHTMRMGDSEKCFLEQYYNKPNEELFHFLGERLNW